MFRHRKLVGQLTHYKFRNLKWAWFRFVPCETNSLLLNINVGEVAVRTQTRETQLDSKMNLGYCKLDTMWGKYNLLETLFRLSVVSFNVHFTFTVKKPCNISNITPCISLQQQKNTNWMPCTKYTALDWISTCHECLKRFFASSQGSYAQSNPRKHDEPAESSSRPPHQDPDGCSTMANLGCDHK